METKKLLNGIISAIIFIALAIGASFSTGFGAVVIFLALALHAGQIVWLYGREWRMEDDGTDIPTGFTYHKPTPSVEDDNDPKGMDQIKTIDEP